MSFGLEVWNRNGAKTLSITSKTALLNQTVNVAFYGSGVRDFSYLGRRVIILNTYIVYSKKMRTSIAVTVQGAKVQVTYTMGGSFSVHMRVGILV